MESSKFNMSFSNAPEMLSYTRGRYRIIGGKYKKRAFLLGMCFLGYGCQLQQTETFIFKHGFPFHSEICISGYLRVDCMEWSHWTSGRSGGMDHMSADFTPWGLLFQGSCSLFHGHLRVTFSAGSDLYSYLPSVANELCAPGQVTNLSEPQFSYLHHRENNENVQGCFEDCCCLGAKLCLMFCDPVNCGPPGLSVHGMSQTRKLEWVSFPSPGNLPDPGIKPMSPILQVVSAIAGRFFTCWATREAHFED